MLHNILSCLLRTRELRQRIVAFLGRSVKEYTRKITVTRLANEVAVDQRRLFFSYGHVCCFCLLFYW